MALCYGPPVLASALCNQSSDRYSWVIIPASTCAVCTHCARSAHVLHCSRSAHALRTQCNNLANAAPKKCGTLRLSSPMATLCEFA